MIVENFVGPEAPFTLLGKTAIVTGGGRGIGRAIVQMLVSAGANVLVSDLDYEALKETQALVRNTNLVAFIPGDLTTPSFPQHIVMLRSKGSNQLTSSSIVRVSVGIA